MVTTFCAAIHVNERRQGRPCMRDVLRVHGLCEFGVDPLDCRPARAPVRAIALIT
jgi:hypothetical protein